MVNRRLGRLISSLILLLLAISAVTAVDHRHRDGVIKYQLHLDSTATVAPKHDSGNCTESLSLRQAFERSNDTLDLFESLADKEANAEWNVSIEKNSLTSVIGNLSELQSSVTAYTLNALLGHLRSASYQNYTLALEARGWVRYSAKQFRYQHLGTVLQNTMRKASEKSLEIIRILKSIQTELVSARKLLARARSSLHQDIDEKIKATRSEKKLKSVLNTVEKVVKVGSICSPVALGTAALMTATTLGTGTVPTVLSVLGTCAKLILDEIKTSPVVDGDEAVESMGKIYDALDELMVEEIRRAGITMEGKLNRLVKDTCKVEDSEHDDEYVDPEFERSVIERFRRLSERYSIEDSIL